LRHWRLYFVAIINGGIGNDILNGGDGSDTINGLAGNDTLNGGKGNDKMAGGAGNDVYEVESAGDKIIEAANQGIFDKVVSSLASFTLGANLEALVLASAALNGTGNTLKNQLVGNGFNNKLDGGAGDDDLHGGQGNDTLLGGAGNDLMFGDEGSDLLDGGAGNDILVEQFGGDTLKGGAGDDVYSLRAGGSTIVEAANAGNDTVVAVDMNFSLLTLENVENVTLFGSGIAGSGNNRANKIIGSEVNNILDGGNGNDTLDGGKGADVLEGGSGNDTFIVDDRDDFVAESKNGGRDTVLASATFTLAESEEIERLTLTGSDSINGTGNEFANVITGNKGNNQLIGGTGNDTLLGGEGDDFLEGGADNDILTGGKGDDFYVIDGSTDKLTEALNQGHDSIISNRTNFTLGANFEDLLLAENDGNFNGTGNSLNNRIAGNAGNNRLDGGAGNDTLDDGAGNDTMIGGAGNDELSSSDGLDVLDGGVGDDTLRDIGGGDTLKGGAGNDLYIVRTTNSTIIEATNGGIDTIEADGIGFSLETLSTVENLTLLGDGNLSGFGNKLANKIVGNANFNLLFGLDGNDTLDGGDGFDQLIGGFGNDTFLVDQSNELVQEGKGQGRDTVIASSSFQLDNEEIENLTLTGDGNTTGIGNNLANTITGNAGNNTLFGGGADDVMAGGKGDDAYTVEQVGDKIVEAVKAGIDTVQSQLEHYTLTANVENLKLTVGFDGTGNSLANEITGNLFANKLDGGAGNDILFGLDGDDTLLGGAGEDDMFGGNGRDTLSSGLGGASLDGGLGADTLIGGSGLDLFAFDLDNVADLAQVGGDTIKGFTRGIDKIDVRDLLSDFGIGIDDIFDFVELQASGKDTLVLFDGGSGSPTLLATVTNAALTEQDFQVLF
jgi:Ca2+-binding RTX toxin-like protein